MNKKEAKELIADILIEYRNKDYSALVCMIDVEPVTGEIVGESGKKYQYEIQAFWDGPKNGDLRVIGSIDDGGFRAFFLPISDGFIKNSLNDFVGE